MDYVNALLVEEEALTYSTLLHRIYPMPRDTHSIEDFHRRRHQDLPEMAMEALEAEVFRCQLRIWLEDDIDVLHWLKERKVEAQIQIHERNRARQELANPRRPVQVFGPPRENQTAEPGEPPATAIPNDPYRFKLARKSQEKERAS